MTKPPLGSSHFCPTLPKLSQNKIYVKLWVGFNSSIYWYFIAHATRAFTNNIIAILLKKYKLIKRLHDSTVVLE